MVQKLEVKRPEQSYPSMSIALGALVLALMGAKYAEVTNPNAREGVYCDAINVLDANKEDNTFSVSTAFHTVGNAQFKGVRYRVVGDDFEETVYNPEAPISTEWKYQTDKEVAIVKAAVLFNLNSDRIINKEECSVTLNLK